MLMFADPASDAGAGAEASERSERAGEAGDADPDADADGEAGRRAERSNRSMSDLCAGPREGDLPGVPGPAGAVVPGAGTGGAGRSEGGMRNDAGG